MTVFASKDAFLTLGCEQIKPSSAHVSQDCRICTAPLAVLPGSTSREVAVSGYHTATRIISCGHVHGEECLNAWLTISNTCPYPKCNRILLEATTESITEHDVYVLLHNLGPEVGEPRVITVVARLIQQQQGQQRALKMMNKVEMGKQKERDDSRRVADEESAMAGEDFVDSDEEMDWNGDEGDEYGVESGEEDTER